MNSLLILENELVADNKAVISGKRKDYLIDRHQIKAGLTLRGGLRNALLGKVTIEKLSAKEIEISLDLSKAPPQRLAIDLIVAVPRPQAVKRLLYFAAISGLRSLSFIRTERVHKSYLSSKALSQEGIEQKLIEGLEQAVDTVMPEVKVIPFFKEFLASLGSFDPLKEQRLLCCTVNTAMSLDGLLGDQQISSYKLAIGPELGWNQFEIASLSAAGFKQLSLGERIFPVDLAATTAINLLSKQLMNPWSF